MRDLAIWFHKEVPSEAAAAECTNPGPSSGKPIANGVQFANENLWVTVLAPTIVEPAQEASHSDRIRIVRCLGS